MFLSGLLARIAALKFRTRVTLAVWLVASVVLLAVLALALLYGRALLAGRSGSAIEPFWQGLPFAVTVLALGAALILPAGAALGRLLARDLGELADAAERIAKNESHLRTVYPGDHEVARLGRAFNTMVTRLESHLQQLRDSRDRLIKPTEAMSEGFALWDSKDRLLLYNRQFCKLLAPIECSIRRGMRFAVLARLINDCLLVRDEDACEQAGLEQMLARHREPRGAQEIRIPNGKWLGIYEFRTPEDEVIGIYSDITERKRREHDLHEGKQRLRAIMNSVIDGILTVTAEGRIESCNVAAGRIFGYPEHELLTCRLDDLIHNLRDVDISGALSIKGLAALPPDHVVEINGRRHDGSPFPIELSVTEIDLQGQPTFIATIRDITSRKATEEMIRYQATHDALTSLPNRTVFDEQLENALELAARRREVLGVMFLDLDRFKMVNDTLGHSVGDALLVGLGQRLNATIGPHDIVARMGGDEFILILRDLEASEDAERRAQAILEAIRPPFLLQGHELHVTASIGISLFPQDGRTSEQLLKMADLALYRAKGSGRNRLQLFTPTMNTSVQEQMKLETELRRALEQKGLSLEFQPQFDLTSGRMVGVETLVRWRHPEMGLVSPQQFIPLAEETGLIHELGLWVLEQACRQHGRWCRAGLGPLRLAVNLSALQFQQHGLERDLEAVLQATGMERRWLELELTESVLMQEGETAERLHRLTENGFSIALDDFGTGYSSLSYLRRFPIDRIKIDRSFVREMDSPSGDSTLARAIIGMAHGLNMQVLAEGVETATQLAMLTRYGCEEAQGFFLGAPVTGERITARSLEPLLQHQPALLVAEVN